MAKSKTDIDIAVFFKIEIVFRANHGNDFAGVRGGDKSSAVADLESSYLLNFLSDYFLGFLLNIKVKGGGDFESSLFDHFLTIFFYKEFFDIHDKVGSKNIGSLGSKFKFFVNGFLGLLLGDIVVFDHAAQDGLLTAFGHLRIGTKRRETGRGSRETGKKG